MRDATCPEFTRVLQNRLIQLQRKHSLSNIQEETDTLPTPQFQEPTSLRRASQSAVSRRKGSAALQITGRLASAGMPSSRVQGQSVISDAERPSLPTMPYFRYVQPRSAGGQRQRCSSTGSINGSSSKSKFFSM